MKEIRFDEIFDDLVYFFRTKSLLPIIGSGFSCGEEAKHGSVPSGKDLQNYMVERLSQSKDFSSDEALSELRNKSFSEISSFFEDSDYVSINERRRYYEDRFTEVKLSEEKKQLLKIDWDYIYTLNIDDAIENNSDYKKTIISNRKPYSDVFSNKRLIKLHGDAYDYITYEDSSCRVFTRKEYSLSIKSNENLLSRLEHDFSEQNILYIGCSLEDEFDLLNAANKSQTNKKVRKIVFSLHKPDVFQKQKYKDLNITDVVLLKSYEELYSRLYDAWCESIKIPQDELSQFCNFSLSRLTQEDDNSDYFYYGKALLNLTEHKITYPFYFIERDIIATIDKSLDNYSVILVEGSSLSGKSYLLAALYEYEKKSKVYYFDSRNRIRASSFETLMQAENCILLFDIGSLERNQFDQILSSIDKIRERNLRIIVILSYDKSDMFGLVKLKIKNKEVESNYIDTINIKKSFSHKEIEMINELLPKVDIPVFFEKKTILDNVISIHKSMEKGRYHDIKLKINDYKELVSLIILFTKERITKLDQIRFGIEMECASVCKRYPKIIEEIETVLIEKDAVDLSNYKYILNAKVWLQNELIKFASVRTNHEIILEAYQHIVKRILLLNGGYLSSRETYREFILFDSINNIFDNGRYANLSLILEIYAVLHKDLANDYQFLHQYSKGLLMFATTKTKKKEKEKLLVDAKTKIQIAESLINKVVENKQNNKEDTYRNLITLNHMRFTESLILCEICELNNYSDFKQIETIVSNLYEIFIGLNIDVSFMEGAEKSERIKRFLSRVIRLVKDDDVQQKINEIISFFINNSVR